MRSVWPYALGVLVIGAAVAGGLALNPVPYALFVGAGTIVIPTTRQYQALWSVAMAGVGAFVVGLYLTLPALCAGSSGSDAPGPGRSGSSWSCESVLGLRLPGSAGLGVAEPALWPSLLLAGCVAVLVTVFAALRYSKAVRA